MGVKISVETAGVADSPAISETEPFTKFNGGPRERCLDRKINPREYTLGYSLSGMGDFGYLPDELPDAGTKRAFWLIGSWESQGCIVLTTVL